MLVLGLGLLTGCGGGAQTSTSNEPPKSASSTARAENVSSTYSSGFTHVRMSHCAVNAGGFDVGIHGVSCKKAKQLVLTLADPFGHNYGRTRSLVYRSDDPQAAGWNCWARLEQKRRVIRHVCWRKAQVLRYKSA
jgi:hypothetical protein